MNQTEIVTLTRNVDAAIVPAGTKVTLQAGEQAQITQSLGSSITVIVNGNMFRIDGRDADALGMEAASEASPSSAESPASTPEELEQQIWASMKTCYDPEIPVNIVDLGLVYDCNITPIDKSTNRVEVKMTLTAPGCGMGPTLQQDVKTNLLTIPSIQEADVDLVWDPPWNQSMMSEAAKLQLGFY